MSTPVKTFWQPVPSWESITVPATIPEDTTSRISNAALSRLHGQKRKSFLPKIDGKIYPTFTAACLDKKVAMATLNSRIASDKFPSWLSVPNPNWDGQESFSSVRNPSHKYVAEGVYYERIAELAIACGCTVSMARRRFSNPEYPGWQRL